MLDVMNQDYIRTARAKGMPRLLVIGKHALRNAAIPVVTIIGLQVAGMVGRCVLVEAVFATKGIGDLVVHAAIGRDYPVLQFGVIFIATLVVVTSIAIDLLYALIDPRAKVAAS
jgi:peptide/nickel transport system permease protein